MATYSTYLNGYGVHERPAPAIVQPGQTLPRIDTSRMNAPIVVREESDVTLSVHVTGRPPPKVTWYIGETTLSPSVEYQMKQKGNVHYLTMLNVSEEVEDGIYVAASNVVGRVKKKIDVKLYRVLTKHKRRPRRTWHSYRQTGVVRRPKNLDAPQRFKSFGSFGQFETLIDGDPDDEVVEDLDEKLYASLCRYKSTPNIRKLSSAENTTDTQQQLGLQSQNTNYTTRCQTLPNLVDELTCIRTRQLTKSTEAIHNELTIKSIPAFEMDFGGFPPQHGSARIPQPPAREEESTSLNDSDFYMQYNRNAQRSVSTFLPPEDTEETQGVRQNVSSSSHDEKPEHTQVADPDWGYNRGSLDLGVRQFSGSMSGSYVLDHDENVLAGNLKKTTSQTGQQNYPKIAPKPKGKKSKKTKDVIVSQPGDAISADTGLHTYENIASLQLGGDKLQQASDHLEEGFYPDHNSSAILYAPDGTMFKLPMTGEYDPKLVLGTQQDRENTTNLSEQNSFAILPNESINLSQGDGPQTNALSVYRESSPADKPTKGKSKTGKRVKKKSKSVADVDVGVTVATLHGAAGEGGYIDDISRSSHQSTALPELSHGYQSENVYENVKNVGSLTSSHQSTNLDVLQANRGLSLSGYYHPANTSFDTSYPKGNVSMYEFEPDHHLSSLASGASIHSVPVTPTSPGTSSFQMRPSRFTPGHQLQSAVTDGASSPMADVTDQRVLSGVSEAAAAGGDSLYGSGRRVGGRRPAQPPPPPPSSGLTPQSPEMYPNNPTKLSQLNQQLISQPASPSHIYASDLDTVMPVQTDKTASSQRDSVPLDYSVPMDVTGAVSTPNVRKSQHRNGDNISQTSEGISLPKKPKVAKKPKHLKQKSLNDSLSTPSDQQQQWEQQQQQQQQQQHVSSMQVGYLPQQPRETNIDEVFQMPSADVQQEMNVAHHTRKVKRSKVRSKSKNTLEQSLPMEEVWIDRAPDLPKQHDPCAPEQGPDPPQSPFTSSDITNASTPKIVKKQLMQSMSEHIPGMVSSQLKAVDINIDDVTDAAVSPGVWETNINGTGAEQTSAGEGQKVKKVIKKKKKKVKSVGDISALVDVSLQPSTAQSVDVAVDGTMAPSEEAAEVKMGTTKVIRKKKKLNKSTGDINAELIKEMVDIDIDAAEKEKPKKKVKKKVTKSVSDLSQMQTSDGQLVSMDSDMPLDSFCVKQVTELPKKKVKKVKKKTKSVGDLTGGEGIGLSVTELDIGDNQRQTDDQQIGEKKKRKKKSLKSQSSHGGATSQVTDHNSPSQQTADKWPTLVGSALETCIDDVSPQTAYQPKVIPSALCETCIDDVLPEMVERPQSVQHILHETFIDDALPETRSHKANVKNVPRETCIDDVLELDFMKDDSQKVTCIDGALPQAAEQDPVRDDRIDFNDPHSSHLHTRVESERESTYENINNLSYEIDSSGKVDVGNIQNVEHRIGKEQMDLLPDVSTQQNPKSSEPRKLETNTDIEFQDALPVVRQHEQNGDLFLSPKNGIEPQNIDLSEQKLYVQETTIDDVFDGTEITSSPQEPQTDLPGLERQLETHKKGKKKRSKSSERRKILHEDGAVLVGQSSLDDEKKIKKKKKKLNKSTGDLTDVGQVLVNIDIDTPAKSAQPHLTGQELTDQDAVTQNVKKKRLTSLNTEGMDGLEQSSEMPTEQEVKKKKKKVTKKLHKSTGDLHLMSTSLAPGQEIYISDSTSQVADAEAMQQAEKKKKKIVKKKAVKEVVQVQETNVDDLFVDNAVKLSEDASRHDDLPIIQTPKGDVIVDNEANNSMTASHFLGDEDVMMTPVNTDDAAMDHKQTPKSHEKNKKKVAKKSKMKSTSDLTDLSTVEVAFTDGFDISSRPTNADTLQEATASTLSAPEVKKKKKVVKKKMNKSLSDLTQTGSTSLVQIEIGCAEDASANMMSLQETLGIPETVTDERKKVKVIKKKKVNKSLSDLSQLQSSIVTNSLAVDKMEASVDGRSVTMTNVQEPVVMADTGEVKKKKVVKKKRVNKSLTDLTEPFEVNVSSGVVTRELMDFNITDNIQAQTSDVKEMPRKKRTVKKKKPITSQSDNVGGVIDVDNRVIQQVEDGIVIQREVADDGNTMDAEMASVPQLDEQQQQQRVQDYNTEPLPSETNVSDIFLDKETMKTVVGDVLETSALAKDIPQESIKMENEEEFGSAVLPSDVNKLKPADLDTHTAVSVIHVDQTVEGMEVITDNVEKPQKKKKVRKSSSDTSTAVRSEEASHTDSTTSDKVTKKKKKTKTKKKDVKPVDDSSQVMEEQSSFMMDTSDIPLIDSDVSEIINDDRLNIMNISQKSESSISELTSSEMIVDRNANLKQEKTIFGDISKIIEADGTEITTKRVDVVADELNNNNSTTPLMSEVIQTQLDNAINETKTSDDDKRKREQRDYLMQSSEDVKIDNLITERQPSFFSYRPEFSAPVTKPEATSLDQSSGMRQTPSVKVVPAQSPTAEPATKTTNQPEPIPVKIHRKKEYPPVKYRPWTDILFGPSEVTVNVKKKEPLSSEASLNSSFADSSVDDGKMEKRSEIKTIYTLGKAESASVRSQPKATDSLRDGEKRASRWTEEVALERKPSLRKETKSLENLADVEVGGEGSFGLTTYNKYDNDEDNEEEVSGKRMRTKSVDNLTLLQQRKRQASTERTTESKREHSKSTGCLLEGRVAKLARRTLTQELLYETVKTVEEVVVIKRPQQKGHSESNVEEAPEVDDATERRDYRGKKERRYLGSLVIVDIYDDRDDKHKDDGERTDVDLNDTDGSADGSYVSDTSRITSSINAIVSDYRKSSARTKREDGRGFSRQSSVTSTETSTGMVSTDEGNKVSPSSSDTSTEFADARTAAEVVHAGSPTKEPTVVAAQAKEVPIDVAPVRLEVVGPPTVTEVKPIVQIESPVAVIAEKCTLGPRQTASVETSTIKHEEASSTPNSETWKDEGIQVNPEELKRLAEPEKASQEFSQQTPEEGDIVAVDDDDDDVDTSGDDGTETDGESGESYDAESSERRNDDDDDLERRRRLLLDAIAEEERETTDREASDVGEDDVTTENIHMTTITITDQVTTIRSSAAAAAEDDDDRKSRPSERSTTVGDRLPADNSVHVLNISLQSENSATDRATVDRTTEPVMVSDRPSGKAEVSESRETQESSFDYSVRDSEGQEEDGHEDDSVDVILPPKESGMRETWEEVVTYEYEFDKETGVKRIVLKPKIVENDTTEYFRQVDDVGGSPPERRAAAAGKSDQLPGMEPESVVVYEFGEMISMYSDATVSDIYLNNSSELGTSGAEGAYAGVERAIDLMVSRELRNAICEVTGQSTGGQTAEVTTASLGLPRSASSGPAHDGAASMEPAHDGTARTMLVHDEIENQEPLPGHLATVELPTDIEINISQMTPNLKRAVEMLRTKYHIVKMSREATPVPEELLNDVQVAAGQPMNEEPLPGSGTCYVDEQMMEEVQEELETVMIELNRMDLSQAVPLAARAPKRRSEGQADGKSEGSEEDSSDADTLVESPSPIGQADQDRHATDNDGDDDDDSGENVIFDMDDVFVKVVTTKEGRIKKIKILEGKEGGDTRKIVCPQSNPALPSTADPSDRLAAGSPEPSRVTDGRYFTRKFYAEEFLAGDEQYESGSGDSDATNEQETPRQHEPSHVTQSHVTQSHVTQISSSGDHFEPIVNSLEKEYEDYGNLPDDHSTDSETSDDADDNEDDDEEEDDDDEEYYEEDEERESPMRSLSPIAEEIDLSELPEAAPASSSYHRRHVVTDSSEEDEDATEEDKDDSVEAGRGIEHLSPPDVLGKQLSESQEDLEILKEFVRAEAASPSEDSDDSSLPVSPAIDRCSYVGKSAIDQEERHRVMASSAAQNVDGQSSTASRQSDDGLVRSQDVPSVRTSADPGVDSENDIVTHKLALEGFLSSLDNESSSSC